MVFGLLGVVGCRNQDVLAIVGGTKVATSDWRLFASSHSPGARGSGLEELQRLTDRELLAEGARRNHLDDDPQVKARLAAAEREVLAQALLEKRLDAASSDREVRAYYEHHRSELAVRRVHMQQIVIRVPANAPEAVERAAQSKALRAVARVRSGEAFGTVAKDLSDDPTAAKNAGELPPLTEGKVDASFFAAAAQLKRGEVSEPVRTSVGFHVLRALEDVQTSVPPFDEIRGQLASRLRREAETRLVQQFREQIGVKVYADRLPAEGHAR